MAISLTLNAETSSNIMFTFKRIKLRKECRGRTMKFNDSQKITKIFEDYQKLKDQYHNQTGDENGLVSAEDGSQVASKQVRDIRHGIPDLSLQPIVIAEENLTKLNLTTKDRRLMSKYFFDNRFFFMNEICSNYILLFKVLQDDSYFNSFICEEFSLMIKKDEFYVDYFKTSAVNFGKIFREALTKHVDKISELIDNKIPRFSKNSENGDKVLRQSFPGFFKEVLNIVFEVYQDFDKTVKAKFRIIRPWTASMLKLFPELDEKQLNTIILNTLPGKIVSRKMYKHLLIHKLRYFKTELKGINHDNEVFFMYIDDFKLNGQYSGCKLRYRYVKNLYFSDCVDLIRMQGRYDNIFMKCRKFISKFFKGLKQRKRLCQYASANQLLIDEMMEESFIQLVDNMNNSRRSMESQVTNKVMQIYNGVQHSIVRKARFLLKTKHIDTHTFNILYFFRDYINEPEFEHAVGNIVVKYNRLKSKYSFFSEKIQNLLHREKLKFVRTMHKEKIAKQSTQRDMEHKLSYHCMLHNENKYASICTKMFKDAKLGMFLKYHHQDFIAPFLVKDIYKNLQKYDFYKNKLFELISYNHIKFNEFIKATEANLMKDLSKIDFNLVDELGRDKIILILIFAHNISAGVIDNFDDIVIPALNSSIASHMTELKRHRYRQDGFFEVLIEIGTSFYNSFLSIPVSVDKLLTSYVRLSYTLSEPETRALSTNMDFLFSHYISWERDLKYFYYLNIKTNFSKIMTKCRNDTKDDEKALCLRQDSTSNLIHSSCPPGSSRIGSDNCYSNCPTGFSDLGMHCRKPRFIRREVYKTLEECGAECEIYDNDYYIPPCPPIYTSLLLYCIPYCTEGSVDYGSTCGKMFVSKIKFFY